MPPGSGPVALSQRGSDRAGTQAQKEELLCTYAALILYDEKMDITAENISKLVKASGASIEPFLPALFARALGEVKIPDLLASASAVGAPAAAAPAGGATAQVAAGAAAAKEEVKVEEEPEEEDDMGFSLFD